jgi:hypothetical protein
MRNSETSPAERSTAWLRLCEATVSRGRQIADLHGPLYSCSVRCMSK